MGGRIGGRGKGGLYAITLFGPILTGCSALTGSFNNLIKNNTPVSVPVSYNLNPQSPSLIHNSSVSLYRALALGVRWISRGRHQPFVTGFSALQIATLWAECMGEYR